MKTEETKTSTEEQNGALLQANVSRSFFSASIRVIKSLVNQDDWENNYFGQLRVLEEKMIEAESKDEVKKILIEKYPQFFQNNKVYEKETKDQAQFFYVIINKLSNWELNLIEKGNWRCESCGEIHDNLYISQPSSNFEAVRPPFSEFKFCKNDYCFESFKKEYYKNTEMPDDAYYVKKDSLNYIYKCTEKSTGKSYIGKTRNAPFFRWWNHLSHSSSPFGIYLRTTKLSDWTFEVLEVLPSNIPDSEVFKVESKYIQEFDSIKNGFNSLISNKSVLSNSGTLFEAVVE